MRLVFSYLKPYRLRMGLGLLIKITGTVIELFLPYILSHILKNVVASESLSRILFWGGLMALFSFLACLANITANRMAAAVLHHLG